MLDYHFMYLAPDLYLLEIAVTYHFNVLQEIQSFNEYLLNIYFLLHTVPGSRDIPVTKINEPPVLKCLLSK